MSQPYISNRYTLSMLARLSQNTQYLHVGLQMAAVAAAAAFTCSHGASAATNDEEGAKYSVALDSMRKTQLAVLKEAWEYRPDSSAKPPPDWPGDPPSEDKIPNLRATLASCRKDLPSDASCDDLQFTLASALSGLGGNDDAVVEAAGLYRELAERYAQTISIGDEVMPHSDQKTTSRGHSRYTVAALRILRGHDDGSVAYGVCLAGGRGVPAMDEAGAVALWRGFAKTHAQVRPVGASPRPTPRYGRCKATNEGVEQHPLLPPQDVT